MKSVEARFRIMDKKFPQSSSLVNFGRAVKGQRFKRPAIARFFGRLVDKSDYAKSDTRTLMRHFLFLSEDTLKTGV